MNSAAEAVQAGDLPGLPLAALARYLTDRVPEVGVAGLRSSLISGGRSNLTYLLSSEAGNWVLRRPPLGAMLATAHDMSREYRMLTALRPTAVPVPRPIHLAEGPAAAAAIGAPFYLMGYAEGTVLRTRDQLRMVADPARLAEGMMRVLADLHAVNPVDVGLGDLGRPDGYLLRQLDRWVLQVGAISSPLHAEFSRVADALRSSLPLTQRVALVHGDYRLDNVVIGGEGQVLAVLDWEMATLGDPLADVASSLVWWDGTTGLDVPVATMPGAVPGFPDGAHLAAAYAGATNLDLSPCPGTSPSPTSRSLRSSKASGTAPTRASRSGTASTASVRSYPSCCGAARPRSADPT